MGLSIKSDGEPDVTGAMISGKAFNAAEGIRKLWVRIPDEQMNDEQHALKLKVQFFAYSSNSSSDSSCTGQTTLLGFMLSGVTLEVWLTVTLMVPVCFIRWH